ncbi:peptidoglycan DD-metalloendopeptidase family protein [Microbulbifer variabilis]|uniref:peptidoglycan DD-metalloendopeptidase family protein n=1 Tax=Microbulbifer variabilis TaxID=266805 RepID=UPI001CFF3EAD|nr:peptidoglycan DD-metalloendopeptidase family protein [Microbulbifer variabilis]
MQELLSSLSFFAPNLFVTSIFSVIWACLIYIGVRTITPLASFKSRGVSGWRSFWLCVLCVIGLPFFLAQLIDLSSAGLVPEFRYDLTPPDADFGHILNENAQLVDKRLAFDYLGILAGGWMILYVGGVLLSLILILRRHDRLVRALNIANEIEFKSQAIGSLLTYQQLDYLSKKNVKLIITKAKCSPFVFGLFNLNLVLPSYLLLMDAKERQLIMEHELTHISRRDLLLIMIAHILVCFLWFIPFVRWVKGQLLWAIELSCDRQVLKSSEVGSGRVYAQAMLRTLQQCSVQASCKGVVAFSVFEEANQLNFFKKRLVNIRETAQEASKPNSFASDIFRGVLVSFTIFLILIGILIKSSFSIASSKKEIWMAPIEGARISSQFGGLEKFRKKPHLGTDFAAPLGTVIASAADGIVVVSTDHYKHENYGKIIIVDHGNNAQTLYSHLDSREVSVGQTVKAGQKIGTVGVTGNVTGPHLHFELIERGERVDPEHLLTLWFG